MHPHSGLAGYRRWIVALLLVPTCLHREVRVAHAGPDGKAEQIITFTDFPADNTVGAPAFAIRAVASSGLAVTFKSLTVGVCATHGHMVTLVARTAGICSIRAHVRGDSRYRLRHGRRMGMAGT